MCYSNSIQSFRHFNVFHGHIFHSTVTATEWHVIHELITTWHAAGTSQINLTTAVSWSTGKICRHSNLFEVIKGPLKTSHGWCQRIIRKQHVRACCSTTSLLVICMRRAEFRGCSSAVRVAQMEQSSFSRAKAVPLGRVSQATDLGSVLPFTALQSDTVWKVAV